MPATDSGQHTCICTQACAVHGLVAEEHVSDSRSHGPHEADKARIVHEGIRLFSGAECHTRPLPSLSERRQLPLHALRRLCAEPSVRIGAALCSSSVAWYGCLMMAVQASKGACKQKQMFSLSLLQKVEGSCHPHGAACRKLTPTSAQSLCL